MKSLVELFVLNLNNDSDEKVYVSSAGALTVQPVPAFPTTAIASKQVTTNPTVC